MCKRAIPPICPLNGLRRDLRRLKRAVRINTVLLMIVLLLTVTLPTTVVLLQP
jgi:hypothetical protein